MSSRTPFRSLMPLLCLPAFAACAQSAPGTPAILDAASGSSAPPHGKHPGSGPDAGEVLLPPDDYHGNWRLVATDDPHGQALMALTVQSSAGEAEAAAISCCSSRSAMPWPVSPSAAPQTAN